MFSPANYAFVFVILVVFQHSTSGFGPHRFRRVINNQYAEEHSRPWMVQLKLDGEHICGAAVIMSPPNQLNVTKIGSTDILLTAAHCAIASTPHDSFTTQYNLNPKRITAHFGKHNSTGFEPWETVVGVNHVLIHPQYARWNDSYDIAIVKLERAVEFNEMIQPVALSPFPLDLMSDCSLAGWGRRLELSPDEDPNAVLTVLQLSNLEDNNTVLIANISSRESTLWAGDSGSPVTCYRRGIPFIQGITSKITRKSDDYKKIDDAIFTSILDNMQWINESFSKMNQPTIYHTEFSKHPIPTGNSGYDILDSIYDENVILPKLDVPDAIREDYINFWFNKSIHDKIRTEYGMPTLENARGYVECQQPAQCAVVCYLFNEGRPCAFSTVWERCYFASNTYWIFHEKLEGISITFKI